MLVGFSFRARPGMEAELEALLADPEGGRRVAAAIGASRNLLLWQGGRMVRIFEFPEGTTPVPLAEVAARDEAIAGFLARVGRLSDPPFDPGEPGSLESFSRQTALRLVYDVRP